MTNQEKQRWINVARLILLVFLLSAIWNLLISPGRYTYEVLDKHPLRLFCVDRWTGKTYAYYGGPLWRRLP